MYIKLNSSGALADLDDYVLINNLPIYINQWKTFENYYLKEQIDEIIQSVVTGDIELTQYVMDSELVEVLKSYVMDIEIEYYLSDSATELIGGEWSNIPQEWTNEKYMWQRMIISYPGIDDNTSVRGVYIPNEDGLCISGAKGDLGEKGQSLINISPQWCLYGDGINPPAEDYDWQDTMPEVQDDMFIWSRFKLTWEYPDEVNYTEPVLDQVLERIKRNVFFTDELNAALETFKQEADEKYQTIENSYTKDETAEELQKVKDEVAEIYITKEDSETNINDAIVIAENKIMNNGFVNLVKNGNFSNKLNNWTVLNGGNVETELIEQIDYPSGRAVVLTGELNVPNKGIQQIITPETKKAGTTFTMSCMMNVNIGNDGEDFAYRLYIEVYNMDKTIEIHEVTPAVFNQWVKIQQTFTVNKDIDYIELHIDLKNTNRILKVSEIMLTYGELAISYVPSVNESNENLISTIDDLKQQMAQLQAEMQELYAIIEELKNNPGQPSPEPETKIASVDECYVDDCYTAETKVSTLNKKTKKNKK